MTRPKLFESETALWAEDDRGMRAHHTCPLCHPENYLGMPALCGEKLLGMDANEDKVDCKKCWETQDCPECGEHLLRTG